jgi:hypothetical protein
MAFAVSIKKLAIVQSPNACGINSIVELPRWGKSARPAADNASHEDADRIAALATTLRLIPTPPE